MKNIVFWDVAPRERTFRRKMEPKRLLKPDPRGATSQKTIFFNVRTVERILMEFDSGGVLLKFKRGSVVVKALLRAGRSRV
jgi:hypothetical protein